MNVKINPYYTALSKFIESLPDIFETEGEVIYKGRNVLKRYVVDGIDLVVKSFKEPILINRVAYTFLRHSKARRSYEYSFELLRRGILTPDPVAYVETYSGGLLKNSYYVSLNLSQAKTLRDICLGFDIDDSLLKSLAHQLLKIHEAGVYHIDLSPGNILYERDSNGNFSFYLIDINRMKFSHHIDMISRARNFERLAISSDVSTRLSEYYSLIAGYPTGKFVDLVNEFTDKFFYTRTVKQAVREYRKDHNVISSVFSGPITRHICYIALSGITGKGNQKSRIFEIAQKNYDKYIKENAYRGGMSRIYGYKK